MLLRDDGTESAGRRIERCGDRAACLRAVYNDAVERGEVVQVLDALEQRGGDCHLEAHRLAHAVYRDLGDVERTFLLGGPQCRFGYLHGAVEASGATATTSARSVRGVAVPACGRFRNPVQQRACAHGFGHALMLRTANDLRVSVAGCREADERYALSAPSCLAGVMMENSLRYSESKRFAAASERGCAAVAGSKPLTELCFDNVGIVAALAVGHDAQRAAALCRGLARVEQRALCEAGAKGEIAEAARG
ncbi:MAG TPA: hypothetical protein VFP31_09090 [Gaiellaceae bacterium]|nr:hypothetical protein [Gaiellaceae bacterium]